MARRKKRFRPNRYNPNAPSYQAVHGSSIMQHVASSRIAYSLELNAFLAVGLEAMIRGRRKT